MRIKRHRGVPLNQWTEWPKRWEQLPPLEEAVLMALYLVRISSEMSQNDIAQRMDCPRSYVSKVENGFSFPTVKQLTRYMAAMDMPMENLLWMAKAIQQGGRK